MLQRLGWLDTYRNLGDSALALIKAEVMLLINDSKRWLFHAARVGAVIVLALIILAYLPFLMMLSAVDGVAQMTGWSLWLSSLVVLLGVCVSIALVFTGVYFWSAEKMIKDNPVAVMQRRIDDHQGWWRHQVTPTIEPEPVVEAAAAADDPSKAPLQPEPSAQKALEDALDEPAEP